MSETKPETETAAQAKKAASRLASKKPAVKPPARRAAADTQPRFYSPDGTDIDVHLPDGRKIIIGETPRTVPAGFFKASLKAGAITTDMRSVKNTPDTPTASDPVLRRDAILEAMVELLDADQDDKTYHNSLVPDPIDPDGVGKPNIRWLNDRLGFEVDVSERDQLWHEVLREQELQDEREADAAEGEDD